MGEEPTGRVPVRTEELRPAVVALVALGRLPTDAQADAEPARADRWESLVGALRADGPVTDAEATALAGLFPEDDSDGYGVAWTLLHVVETASGWPSAAALAALDGPWADVLRRRAKPGR